MRQEKTMNPTSPSRKSKSRPSPRSARSKDRPAPIAPETAFEFPVTMAGQLVYEWDPEADSIRWGGGSARLLGYPLSELTGGIKQWLGLIHPDDRKNVLRVLETARKKHAPFELLYRLRRKDGRYLRIADRGYFLPAEGRRPRRMLGVIQDVTEHERIGKALQESERRYHSLVSRVPVGLYRTSAAGIILDFNLTGARMFGYATPEDVIQKKASSFYLNPRDRFLTYRIADRNGVFDFEARMKKRDGSVIWVRILGQIIRDAGGNILFFEGSLEDITDRRRIDSALKESMELFSSLIQRSPVPTAVHLDNGRIETVNDRFIECFGYTLGEIPTLDAWFRKAYPDRKYRRDVLAIWNKALERAAQDHVDIEPHEYRVTRKDGKVRIVEIFGAKIGGRNLVMLTDITERRLAEERLAESEEQFRTLIELSPDPIFLHTEGVIRYVNSAGLALLGAKEPGQVVSRSVYDFVHPSLHADLQRRYWAGVKTMQIIPPTEEQYVRLDGSVVDVEAMAKPIVLQGKVCAQVIVRDITERKRMLETLRANEERFRTIVENSPSGIFIVGPDFKFQYINSELSRILGVPPGEVVGLDFKTFVDEESIPVIQERYERRKRGESAPSRYEIYGRRRNGEKRLIELSTSVVRDPQGRMQIIGQLLDITERRQAEEKDQRQSAFDEMLAGIAAGLASSSGSMIGERLESCMAEISAFFRVESAYVILSSEDRRTWSMPFHWGAWGKHENTAAMQGIPTGTFPWSEGEMMNGRVIQFETPEELPAAAEIERGYYGSEGLRSMLEVPFHGKDGLIIGCIGLRSFSHAVPWSPDDARWLGIVGELLANVFDRKRMEDENRRRTEELETLAQFSGAMRSAENRSEIIQVILRRLSELFNADGTAILIRDAERNGLVIESGYRAWEHLTGRRLAFADGVIDFSQPYVNNDALRNPGEMDPGLIGGLPSVACIPLIADRYTIGLLGIGRRTPITDSDVRLFAAIGDMAANAIKRQSLTEDLRIQVHNLQQTRSRLLQSEKLAAIGELVSGVAHELNNPLTSIVLYSQLITQENLDPAAKTSLGRITSEALRAGKIVRDLLDFSRQRPVLREFIQVNDVVKNSVEFLAYELKSHNITWKMDLAHNLPMIMADPHQLTQVCINLVQNAWQAQSAAHGGGTLKIWSATSTARSADSPTEENRTVRIGFHDDGPGIPDDVLGRIFDPFFTTKPEGTGTGLGLSICHGIITEHGGQIWAESAPGEGTTFIIELPIILPGEKAEAKPQLPAILPVTAKGGRILVLDDEPNIRNVLTQSLQRLGYTVDTASNGADGMELTAKTPYAFVLCDIRMPGISGLEFYARTRERDPREARKIIFITGDTANKATRDFIEQNKIHCLRKPFELSDLQLVIQQASEA
jgi:PAS domain S-box-containing protein